MSHSTQWTLGRCGNKICALGPLSECDVGTSGAVVNGLAPSSNGQDKGKALQEKSGLVLKSISTRCRVCWAGVTPPAWGKRCLLNQVVKWGPSPDCDFLRPGTCSCFS